VSSFLQIDRSVSFLDPSEHISSFNLCSALSATLYRFPTHSAVVKMDPPECSGHSHDHEHGDELGTSLRPQFDFPRVVCFNEEVPGSGRAVLKLHEERLTAQPNLCSPEDDPELLLTIPFTESVTIQSISVRGGAATDNTSPPKTILLFTNREDLDFDTARELPSQMTLELLPPHHFAEGSIDYPLRPAGRFQNVSSISLYFVDNYEEGKSTEITFIGLKGKGSNMKRMAVETVYESRGMLADHKVPDEVGGRNVI
jgi:hypothetical protein